MIQNLTRIASSVAMDKGAHVDNYVQMVLRRKEKREDETTYQ
jgi:hypothetical protein